MTDPILEVRGLQKQFVTGGFINRALGNHDTIHAVERVDFRLSKGETLALIGESGCGKSTVAKSIMGVHEPTAGEVLYDGTRLSSEMVPQTPIQIIFQDPAESLNPRKTVGSNIAKPLRLRNESNVGERVDDLIRRVGLETNIKNRYPGSFSGGQKQRIAIARALASDPEVLIADEPVSGLDVSVQAKIINLLQDIQDDMDLSLLVISHNLGIVRTIADRVCIMYLGEIVEKGPTDEIFTRPAHPYTKMLIDSIQLPDPTPGEQNRSTLTGEPPSAKSPPGGCKFHTRCPAYIGEICEASQPELTGESSNPEIPLGQRHEVSCHLVSENR